MMIVKRTTALARLPFRLVFGDGQTAVTDWEGKEPTGFVRRPEVPIGGGGNGYVGLGSLVTSSTDELEVLTVVFRFWAAGDLDRAQRSQLQDEALFFLRGATVIIENVPFPTVVPHVHTLEGGEPFELHWRPEVDSFGQSWLPCGNKVVTVEGRRGYGIHVGTSSQITVGFQPHLFSPVRSEGIVDVELVVVGHFTKKLGEFEDTDTDKSPFRKPAHYGVTVQEPRLYPAAAAIAGQTLRSAPQSQAVLATSKTPEVPAKVDPSKIGAVYTELFTWVQSCARSEVTNETGTLGDVVDGRSAQTSWIAARVEEGRSPFASPEIVRFIAAHLEPSLAPALIALLHLTCETNVYGAFQVPRGRWSTETTLEPTASVIADPIPQWTTVLRQLAKLITLEDWRSWEVSDCLEIAKTPGPFPLTWKGPTQHCMGFIKAWEMIYSTPVPTPEGTSGPPSWGLFENLFAGLEDEEWDTGDEGMYFKCLAFLCAFPDEPWVDVAERMRAFIAHHGPKWRREVALHVGSNIPAIWLCLREAPKWAEHACAWMSAKEVFDFRGWKHLRNIINMFPDEAEKADSCIAARYLVSYWGDRAVAVAEAQKGQRSLEAIGLRFGAMPKSAAEWLWKHRKSNQWEEVTDVALAFDSLPEDLQKKGADEMMAWLKEASNIDVFTRFNVTARSRARWLMSQQLQPRPWLPSLDVSLHGMTARWLPRDDPRGVMLGNLTSCCQSITGAGATAAWHGQENPDGAFLVWESETERDQFGSPKILAQAWVWKAEGVMCLDSIEVPAPNRTNPAWVRPFLDVVALTVLQCTKEGWDVRMGHGAVFGYAAVAVAGPPGYEARNQLSPFPKQIAAAGREGLAVKAGDLLSTVTPENLLFALESLDTDASFHMPLRMASPMLAGA